jgi:hypothetical protein
MKVTVEYLKGSERTKEEYYYVDSVDYDPVHVALRQSTQNVYLPSAQILRMYIEDDPEVLIF